MSSGTWLNQDGLYLKYGTAKAIPATGGEYCETADGGNRVVEFLLDLTTLNTSTATIIEDNVFFPTGMFIEEVQLVVETAAAGSTATLSIGLMETDRATALSGTAFASAVTQSALGTAGDKIILNAGSTGAGTYIGSSTNPTQAGYVTAEAGTAAFTAGKVRVRIKYHGLGTITE
ncbi:MAG: hypothetical protein ACREHG_00995 [Candidatus Saccharimonadales bacterium]